MLLSLLSAGCAEFDEDAAIEFVAGFGGETNYDPCKDEDGNPSTVDPQCAATQAVKETEREKEAADLTAAAQASIANEDYEAARAALDKAITLRPRDRDLHGKRIVVDTASGNEPSPVDLVVFAAKRDQLAVHADLAIVHAGVLNYLILNDGAPEAITRISDAYCELRAMFEYHYTRLPIKDQTKELNDRNVKLQAHRLIKSLHGVACIEPWDGSG